VQTRLFRGGFRISGLWASLKQYRASLALNAARHQPTYPRLIPQVTALSYSQPVNNHQSLSKYTPSNIDL